MFTCKQCVFVDNNSVQSDLVSQPKYSGHANTLADDTPFYRGTKQKQNRTGLFNKRTTQEYKNNEVTFEMRLYFEVENVFLFFLFFCF